MDTSVVDGSVKPASRRPDPGDVDRSSALDGARDCGPSSDDGEAHGVERSDLIRIALVALAILLNVAWVGFGSQSLDELSRALASRVPDRSFPALFLDGVLLVAAIAGGFPIYREAYEALRHRRMTMELSMTIAILAALLIGELLTTVVIVLFVLVAEVLEGLTVGRGRHAIRDLLDLLPKNALVRRAGGEADVPILQIAAGDVVVVKPGGRLPVDGTVVGGHSFVDQATITGESMPVEKTEGARVFAGTFNQSGVLEVRAEGIGRDTAFGRIIAAVERAEASRAPIQKTADRLAGYLVYFALGCATITFLLSRDPRATISVVIVAGACGIAAGTPLAILGAIGRAARFGAIMKGGLHLETLGRIDTVVLDKTGTLTLGAPRVDALSPAPGASEIALLEAAAIAEKRSEHPLGRAVLEMAAARRIAAPPPELFEYTPGMGIACTFRGEPILVGARAWLEAHGVALEARPALPPTSGRDHRTEIWVSRNGRFLGTLHLADVLRPEAKAAVAALRAMGLRTVLLTGDSSPIAAAVGQALGVDEIEGDLLPEEKLARVTALKSAGRTVAMVGDGINDAPALIAADVGIAMGSGTDVAREGADVLLVGDDLLKLVKAISIARWCRRIIFQNFAGTLIVDGAGVALAAFGWLSPLSAAFIHVASELLFILNSTRLLPSRGSAR